jgi:hypothetical protein
MGLVSGHTKPPSKTILENRQVFTNPTRYVPPLFDRGVQVFNSADKAELLAQHFERIHHLNLKVGTANHARIVNRTVNKYYSRSHPHVPQAHLIKPYELGHLIQSLKTKSAPGTDGISATKLRNLSRTALVHLTQIFNHILRSGYFPYAWKSAKVIPIQKPGKPLSDPGSHRIISLLSTVSKLLERVVAHKLSSFIQRNHILPPEKFGFRKRHSTVSQLARITDFITHAFNLRKHTGMVLLDTEKAYDTVRLNDLLFNLISLHLPDYLLLFLLSYLEGRTLPFTQMTLPPPQSLTP